MAQEVILGLGNASGMFYHAPKGTALPEGPFAELAEAWKKVGDITSDGITLTLNRSTEDLKNWANQTKRTIMTDHSESIKAPIMDTTEETMKVIFGENNVQITDSATDHGKLVNVHISSSELPKPEAYLFLMKDGDTGIMLGCSEGQMAELSDTTFAPGSGITWEASFKGQGEGWTMIVDDGEKATA